ncbi:MAG: DUF5916 domain-containing protein [Gemmatimonadales bacterium]
MDEPAWDDAVRMSLDWEWFPGDNIAPPAETQCRITYDVSNLYIGCRAWDPDPSAIRAHYADRDDLERTPQDDHFVFLLDPFNDQRRAFQFRINAVGVQMDAMLSTAEGFEDFSWDAIWASAGRITDDGYTVEAAIPFRSLRFPKTRAAQTWGFIAERSYPRSDRHRMRSMPTDRNNSCLLCQANKLDGLEGISPGRNLELYPTVTSGRTDSRPDFPSGALENGDIDLEPGLDVRWGITPNVSLNATVNPDFSQVEADVAQLDVNTRFALFFPEKRPFFLEGADFFVTPLNAVFTRTVADPAGGLKLTGKEGANGVGLFAAYDRVTNLVFPASQSSSDTSLADSALSVVARYRRDVGRASYVGVLYTGREAAGYHNRVTGADAFVQLSPTHSLRLQVLASETDYPDSVAAIFGQPRNPFSGSGVGLELIHASRNWAANIEYEDLGPQFRVDQGFEPRVNQRSLEAGVTRLIWGRRGGWFTQLGFRVEASGAVDYDGTLTERSFSAEASYLGAGQTSAYAGVSRDRRRFLDKDHDLTRLHAGIRTRPAGWLSFGGFGLVGDAVDFSNNRRAFAIVAGPSAQLSIGRPITLTVQHNIQRLEFGDTHIFTAHLFQTRLFYHFNVRTFVRAILQYQNVARNPVAYSLPIDSRARSLFAQLLFSYKLNPQTVVFLGYSDNRSGSSTVSLTQSDRTFFVKLGYALRP